MSDSKAQARARILADAVEGAKIANGDTPVNLNSAMRSTMGDRQTKLAIALAGVVDAFPELLDHFKRMTEVLGRHGITEPHGADLHDLLRIVEGLHHKRRDPGVTSDESRA